MRTKSRDILLKRIEQAMNQGVGVHLSPDEVRLLMAAPSETSRPTTKEPRSGRLDAQVRWLIRRDMKEVIPIENENFARPWSDEDFLCCLRQRNCIGMVAECDNRVVGYMIYELHKNRLHVLNFAVAKRYQRRSIGTQMIARLIDKLTQQQRNEILLELRESNLDGQVFFKKLGFKAVLVLRGHFEDTGEDAYIMQFLLPDEMSTSPAAPQNRISGIGEEA